MAINPKLPYPRLRCGYRTQSGRQCRLHVLDPKDTLCPQHVYARGIACLSRLGLYTPPRRGRQKPDARGHCSPHANLILELLTRNFLDSTENGV